MPKPLAIALANTFPPKTTVLICVLVFYMKNIQTSLKHNILTSESVLCMKMGLVFEYLEFTPLANVSALAIAKPLSHIRHNRLKRYKSVYMCMFWFL